MPTRLKRFLANRAALIIYKSMILPYLDYADLIYSPKDIIYAFMFVCMNVCMFVETNVIS